MRLQSAGRAVTASEMHKRWAASMCVCVCLDVSKCLLHVAFIGSFVSWWMLNVLSYYYYWHCCAYKIFHWHTYSYSRRVIRLQRWYVVNAHRAHSMPIYRWYMNLWCRSISTFGRNRNTLHAATVMAIVLSQATCMRWRKKREERKLDTILITIERGVESVNARDFFHLKQNDDVSGGRRLIRRARVMGKTNTYVFSASLRKLTYKSVIFPLDRV